MKSNLMILGFLVGILSARGAFIQPGELLHDPTAKEWKSLEQYDGNMTRSDFECRLNEIFDPSGSLSPYLKVTDNGFTVFASTNRIIPLATVSFSPAFKTACGERKSLPVASPIPSPSPESNSLFGSLFSWLSSPVASPNPSPDPSATRSSNTPLTGLRVVIETADIGGAWASMEDRSTFYPGFGRIQEGDLNLSVSKALSSRLKQLGAEVYVTRESMEPVSGLTVPEVEEVVPEVLAHRSYLLSKTFNSRTENVRSSSPMYQKVAAEVLLTKNLEARARGQKTREAIHPDITIVLQFDATSARRRNNLPRTNRNILFVEGAYTPREISNDPRQRLRLLTKLCQNVTPVEIEVAKAISRHLVAATGFPPVLYGNSRITRSIAGDPYVVARNILLNREHDGAVVVTEPYFMNQPETLLRLLAGDYDGIRVIAGNPHISIYREYAGAVADGLREVYGKNNQSHF